MVKINKGQKEIIFRCKWHAYLDCFMRAYKPGCKRWIGRVVFLEPGVFHIELSQKNVWSNIEHSDAEFLCKKKETKENLILETDLIRIHIQKDPFGINVYNNSGKMLLRTIEYSGRDWEIKCPKNMNVYGGGLRFDGVNLAGKVIKMQSKGVQWPKYDDTYTVIPFFMTSAGYGLLWTSPQFLHFDFRNTQNGSYVINIPENIIPPNFYFFYGPDIQNIHRQYMRVSGLPYLPPEWAFEPLIGFGFPYKLDTEYLSCVLKERRKHKIQFRTIFFDWGWDPKFGELTFRDFKDPRETFSMMHKEGLKVIAWVGPFLNPESKVAKEAEGKGYLVRSRFDNSKPMRAYNGFYIDFTNPEAVKWQQERIERILRLGLDGLFADFGESDEFRLGRFANGNTGNDANAYTIFYHQCLFEALKKVKGDDFYFLARAGFTGIQKTNAIICGDPGSHFDFLRTQIRGIQSAGLSGVPFTSHNIGGYDGWHRKDVFLRWTQMATFSPLFSIWGNAGPIAPWDFKDKEIIRIFKAYSDLRVDLLPYIYATARQAKATGIPIMRAMAFAFPKDKEADRHEDQYMFGDAFLVAPVLSRENRQSIYLPDGVWYDFWSNAMVRGPKKISYPVPLERIPVFVKAGEVIPMRSGPFIPGESKGYDKRRRRDK